MVSNHKIVSGTAKGGAVSVFYVKGESDPNVSVEAASKEFSSDNVKVTLRAQDADNLKYTTTEARAAPSLTERSFPLVKLFPSARPLPSR